MNKNITWVIVGILLILSMVLSACNQASSTTSTSVTQQTTQTTSKSVSPSSTSTTSTVKTISPSSTSTSAAAATGEPKYGGTIINREADLNGQSFDPSMPFNAWYTAYWMEQLFQPNLAIDRAKWPFNVGFTPMEYMTGCLAEKWEQTDPLTWVIHLRQGVKWQNKAPVNGREFTANDVQYSYDMMLGTGSGFDKPNMFWASAIADVERVVATDKYTVQFKLKFPSAMAIYQITEANVLRSFPIVAKEWVEQGDTQNWKNAVGTGPFILTDFVAGSSETLVRNSSYWGYDEHYPKNQLPYVDTYKMAAIPDMATTMAALRSGQIDLSVQTRGGMTWQEGQSLAKTNKEIPQVLIPDNGNSIMLRCDKSPFTDINVRKALQMALDLPAIAKGHWGGVVSGVPTGVVSPQYAGWALPFDKWPADLQAEYSYNVAKARELLATAGYPNGFKTNCLFSAADDQEAVEIIKSYFKDISVDMEIKSLDPTTYTSLTSGGKADQMVFTVATQMPFGPDWCIRMLQSTDTRDNYTMNNDPVYDAMIGKFDTATTVDEAKQISIDADQYLLRQHWMVQTFPTAKVFAWQKWVKGYNGELIIGSPMIATVPARIWVDETLKK